MELKTALVFLMAVASAGAQILSPIFSANIVGYSGYTTRKTITFPHASGAQNLSNVDQAFTATVSGIQHTVVPFTGAQTAPADFILTTDASCGTVTGINGWDIEYYNSGTGALIGHVGLPSLTTSFSVVLYACWQNASVSTWQGGSRGAAYDANTACIYHLPDGTTPSFVDWTAHAYDGTNVGTTATAGELDGGLAVTAGAYFTLPSTCGLTSDSSVTLSAWVKSTSFANVQRAIIINAYYSVISLHIDTASHVVWLLTNSATGSTTLSTNTWYLIAGTWNNSSFLLVPYVNGVADATPVNSGTPYGPPSGISAFGDAFFGSFSLIGSGDEARIDSVTRTAGWLRTQALNQAGPPAAL